MKRVLVVEDNRDLAYGLRNNLEIEGYQVEVADDGPKGLMRARTTSPDLVILDLMLPGMDGYRVLRALREEGRQIPILILTARGEEADKVRGLRLGADDYVTKPLRLRELVARMAAHLRRARLENAEAMRSRLEFRELVIDVNERRTYKSGQEVELTHTEFDLLTFLASNAGKVLSREKILNSIWGYEYPIETRVIDVHIRNLRRKIETQASRPYYILAVPGIGYRFTNARPA
jgi:DNA-binding response OmpR family regulator